VDGRADSPRGGEPPPEPRAGPGVALSPPRLGYQPAFDGLRAVAVLLVVGAHVQGAPLSAGGAGAITPRAGWLGVDLFFVLSGFLITTLLLEERALHGGISLARFYSRRALRLVPALVFFLLVAALGDVALGIPLRDHLASLLLGLTYTTNVGVMFGHFDLSLGHLWSLAMEEQFYLVWPPLLIILGRRLSVRRIGIAALAAAVALAAARFALTPPDARSVDWAFVTRFDSILIGCAAACAPPRLRRLAGSPGPFPVAVLAMAALVVLAPTREPVYRGATFAFALATAVVLLGLVGDGARPHRPPVVHALLASMPFVLVGRISYALYLWHRVIEYWVADRGVRHGLALTVAVSMAAAAVSYVLVERPFLRLKWRLARTPTHDADPLAPRRPAAVDLAPGG
jgi:peptidoglycan/LPS O-acetylase OafA/YrhL